MKPKWQKLASLAQEICTLWFQYISAVFAPKGYPLRTYSMYDYSSVASHTHNIIFMNYNFSA